jgi:serine phosphatase RsbU (regulator of sigma subunit)
MFGKEPVCQIVRRQSDGNAKKIMDSIVGELELFRNNRAPEDDITLVVIKIKATH